jgi:hypothetical protein
VVGSVNRGAKKIFEEIMEEPSLCLVGEDHIAILILKVFDLILAKVARSTKVEIPGVFVAQDAVFDLGTLPPVSGFVGYFVAEGGFGKGTKAAFKSREAAMLLQAVKERNDSSKV